MKARFVIAAAVSLLSAGLFAATIASTPVQGVIIVDWQRLGDCALTITGMRLYFPPPAGEHIMHAPDERSLLLHVAHEIAAALHGMQAREHAELVGALATGLIDPGAARSRAKELRALT